MKVGYRRFEAAENRDLDILNTAFIQWPEEALEAVHLNEKMTPQAVNVNHKTQATHYSEIFHFCKDNPLTDTVRNHEKSETAINPDILQPNDDNNKNKMDTSVEIEMPRVSEIAKFQIRSSKIVLDTNAENEMIYVSDITPAKEKNWKILSNLYESEIRHNSDIVQNEDDILYIPDTTVETIQHILDIAQHEEKTMKTLSITDRNETVPTSDFLQRGTAKTPKKTRDINGQSGTALIPDISDDKHVTRGTIRLSDRGHCQVKFDVDLFQGELIAFVPADKSIKTTEAKSGDRSHELRSGFWKKQRRYLPDLRTAVNPEKHAKVSHQNKTLKNQEKKELFSEFEVSRTENKACCSGLDIEMVNNAMTDSEIKYRKIEANDKNIPISNVLEKPQPYNCEEAVLDKSDTAFFVSERKNTLSLPIEQVIVKIEEIEKRKSIICIPSEEHFASYDKHKHESIKDIVKFDLKKQQNKNVCMLTRKYIDFNNLQNSIIKGIAQIKQTKIQSRNIPMSLEEPVVLFNGHYLKSSTMQIVFINSYDGLKLSQIPKMISTVCSNVDLIVYDSLHDVINKPAVLQSPNILESANTVCSNVYVSPKDSLNYVSVLSLNLVTFHMKTNTTESEANKEPTFVIKKNCGVLKRSKVLKMFDYPRLSCNMSFRFVSLHSINVSTFSFETILKKSQFNKCEPSKETEIIENKLAPNILEYSKKHETFYPLIENHDMSTQYSFSDIPEQFCECETLSILAQFQCTESKSQKSNLRIKKFSNYSKEQDIYDHLTEKRDITTQCSFCDISAQYCECDIFTMLTKLECKVQRHKLDLFHSELSEKSSDVSTQLSPSDISASECYCEFLNNLLEKEFPNSFTLPQNENGVDFGMPETDLYLPDSTFRSATAEFLESFWEHEEPVQTEMKSTYEESPSILSFLQHEAQCQEN